MQCRALLAIAPRGVRLVIGEEIHFCLEKTSSIDEGFDFKTTLAATENVEASVRIAMHHSHDLCGASDDGQALSTGAHHSEFALTLEAFLDHLFVSVLEDMQRQRCPREQHQIEREYRNFHSLSSQDFVPTFEASLLRNLLCVGIRQLLQHSGHLCQSMLVAGTAGGLDARMQTRYSLLGVAAGHQRLCSHLIAGGVIRMQFL